MAHNEREILDAASWHKESAWQFRNTSWQNLCQYRWNCFLISIKLF